MPYEVTMLDDMDRKKVSVNPVTRCWEWTASIRKDGYGQATRKGKNVKAHRYVYQVLVGPLADGVQQLDHLCRIRHCVNPDHLSRLWRTSAEDWPPCPHRYPKRSRLPSPRPSKTSTNVAFLTACVER